jgi:hypothetical protein
MAIMDSTVSRNSVSTHSLNNRTDKASAPFAGEEMSLAEGSKHLAGAVHLKTNPVQVSV